MRHEFWWGCRTSLENPNARQSDGIYKNNLQQLERLNKTPNQAHTIFFFLSQDRKIPNFAQNRISLINTIINKILH